MILNIVGFFLISLDHYSQINVSS
uniref:Uncharacterized protein n=1 Tax=Arundo donax TaxID=35708 RepID=A0A0A9A5H5_ARUDO